MKKILYTIGFMLLVFASQSAWLSFAPVTSRIAEQLGVPNSYIGLIAVVYPLLFLFLTIPTGILIDRALNFWLWFASILTLLAALGRFLGENILLWYAFQVLGGLGQPFLLNSFAPVARALYPHITGRVITLMSIAMYGGMAFSLFTGVWLYEAYSLTGIFLAPAVSSLFGIGFLFFAKNAIHENQTIPHEVQSRASVSLTKELWEYLKNPTVLLLGTLLGLGVGTFDNLSTWLEPALKSIDLHQEAGKVVAFAILLGILGVATSAQFAIHKQYHIVYLRFAIFALISVLFALAWKANYWTVYILILSAGFIMFPAYPIILDLIAHRFAKPGTVTGAVGFISRVITVILNISAAYFIEDAVVFFTFLALCMLPAVFLSFRLK